MEKFEELGLCDEILEGIEELGFEEPTAIQQKVIPQLLADPSDVVALAQTGTGKTAAFGLPLLQLMEPDFNKVQAVILSPTRELCLQIANDLEAFSKHIRGLRVTSVYGGVPIDRQIRSLRRGTHVVVATPGRLADIINRGAVDLSEVNIAVLDEADEMLNMGFKEELDSILDTTPTEKHTWLFSATMPREVARIAKNYMTNPIEVAAGEKNISADNIDHRYFLIHPNDRYETLKRLVDFFPDIFGIIFCKTKLETQDIADNLIRDGYNADSLHGDLTQGQRDRVMKKFRDRSLQILVATDVAARGIDVSDITHVINYKLPDDIEAYTHRSGRTARAGKKGMSIILATKSELYNIRRIEKIIKKQISPTRIPSGMQVCEARIMTLVKDVSETEVHEEEISHFIHNVNEHLEDLSREELIKKFVSVQFNQFLKYYKGSQDLNKRAAEQKGRGGRDGRDGRDRRNGRGGRDKFERGNGGGGRRKGRVQQGYKRYFINVGSEDDISTGQLIDFICKESSIRGRELGRIDIKDRFSFFEVREQFSSQIESSIRNSKMNGRKVRVEEANSK